MKSLIITISLLFAAISCNKGGKENTPPEKQPEKVEKVPEKTPEKKEVQEKYSNLIPRKKIFGNPLKTGFSISPDGKKIAYIAPLNNVLNVWVETIGKNDAQAVTKDTYRGITNYIWTKDSSSLLYAQDKGGNENFTIYQVKLDKLTVKALTPEKDVRAGIVATNKRFPNEVLISMNARDKKVFDIHRLNLKTGKMVLDTKNPGNVLGWLADYNMKIRAGMVMDKDAKKSLIVRTTPNGKWKTLLTWDYLESGGPVGFTKDGRSLYIMGNKGSDKYRLYTIDIATGKKKEIYTNEKADISDVMIHPDKMTVVAVTTEYIKKEWKIFDKEFQKDFDAMKKLAGDLRFGLISHTSDLKKWIVATAGPKVPGKYYIYDRTKGTFDVLADTRPELKDFTLNEMKPVEITARDGLKLVSYLTIPAHPIKNHRPMILLVHGGPWHRDRWSFDGMAQWLANRGYWVLQVNFRGSTGFGKNFLNAGNKEWGRNMQHDLTDAVAWAIKNENIDPKFVGIMGGSYGGYATLAGVTFTPDLYAAAVDIVGPSSIETLLKTVPPYWKPMMALFSVRVGDIEKDLKMIRERSPLHYADRIKTPLAIFQGANDPRVKVSESDQMVQAIRKNKKEVMYIVYPDEGHGFKREPNRMDFLARTEVFLAKYLKGRFEPWTAWPGHTAKEK
ncbi:S9 family peptidase [Myxococcota bacterium]|nr:S9 family peptidase [Myxococcota bacterium]MBU1381178.1 S9 family peptidase [Myxococcota bacterium]MBU1498786.1 S9 family peptidase [Myxococcota bacterium]